MKARAAAIHTAKAFVFAGFALLFLDRVWHLATHLPARQGDFSLYARAAGGFLQGGNPYSVRGFIYPPAALPIFLPFGLLPFKLAHQLYLALKLTATCALLGLWLRRFIPRSEWLSFLIFACVAYNSALYTDITYGNISTFEQVCLWLGLHGFLTRRNPWWLAVGIAGAAYFKFTLFFFLGLLLFEGRKGLRVLLITASGFLCLQIVSYLVTPELFSAFLRNMPRIEQINLRNSDSTPWMLMLEIQSNLTQTASFTPILAVVYGSWACCTAGISLHAAIQRYDLATPDGRMHAITLAALLYSLLVPRLLNYSCILLILPAFVVLRSLPPRPRVALGALCVAPMANSFLKLGVFPLWEYQPLFVNFLLWLAWIHQALQPSAPSRMTAPILYDPSQKQ